MTGMRYRLLVVFGFLIPFALNGQTARQNKKPKIQGQSELATNEEQAIQLQLLHLRVEDDGWWYPWGYTLRVFEGSNYTLNGTTVTPVLNFSGTLSVPVTVFDGEEESGVYHVQITVNPVNDPPVITGQQAVTTEQSTAVTILLSHLTVTDPDDSYPADFTLIVEPPSNDNYTVSGHQVTPAPNFEGMLSVSVRVNDGAVSSEPFALQVKVNPGNSIPVIVSHVPVSVIEDNSVTLQLSQFIVTDEDNPYPTGFTLRILPGNSYQASGQTVTPARDYAGVLTVNVAVHDGISSSAAYAMPIQVVAVNDPPVISNMEEDPLPFNPDDNKIVAISATVVLSDPDHDSLTMAEISFNPGKFQAGADELLFEDQGTIKGTFDMQRGTLKLSGAASTENYQKAIRAVRYRFNTQLGVTFQSKLVYISVSDGVETSEKKDRQLGEGLVQVQLDIPTAFTPNGDLANDTWKIRPLKTADELNKAVVRIYNRAGYLLFEAIGFDKEWDGRLNGEVLPADTYFYTIYLNAQFTSPTLKGIVTILR
jgi:gliding motility-associated-like protein